MWEVDYLVIDWERSIPVQKIDLSDQMQIKLVITFQKQNTNHILHVVNLARVSL